MPTTLPRETVTFKRDIHETLEELADRKGVSMSQLISELVETSLDFVEDIALGEIAEDRLKTFSRDDAKSLDETIKWNQSRKKK
jgi:predicted DNA-binding protein